MTQKTYDEIDEVIANVIDAALHGIPDHWEEHLKAARIARVTHLRLLIDYFEYDAAQMLKENSSPEIVTIGLAVGERLRQMLRDMGEDEGR